MLVQFRQSNCTNRCKRSVDSHFPAGYSSSRGREINLESRAVPRFGDDIENVVDDFLLDLRLTEEDRRDGRSIEFAGSVEDLKRELGA